MLRRIGCHAHDLGPFLVDHLPPIGVSLNAGSLRKPLTTSRIAAAAGHELNAVVLRQRLRVSTVQAADLLSADGVARNLVTSADKSEANDHGSIGWFLMTHTRRKSTGHTAT